MFLFLALLLVVLQVYMYHWDRDTAGTLQRASALIEEGCEVSLNSEQMDPLPEEEQQSQ